MRKAMRAALRHPAASAALPESGPAGQLLRWLRHLLGARQGSVAAEFAMALPILMLIALSGAEIARYVALHQKLARAAVTMADLVAQAEEISEGEVSQLFAAVDPVMTPFVMGERGLVIISSVTASDGNPPRISWQRTGGGSLGGASSEFGTEGASAALPDGFIVRDGETAIVAEAYYSYAPIFTGGLVQVGTVYQRALFRPRFGALAAIVP